MRTARKREYILTTAREDRASERSPFVTRDADGGRQRLSHSLHKLLKLSFGNDLQLTVVLLEQLVLLDDFSVACAPTLRSDATHIIKWSKS